MIQWHRHGEYSHVASLDGLGTAEQYAARAEELGQTALGLTDHASLAGALHHIRACRARSIVPIVGCEIYFRENRRWEKEEGVESSKANHLCLHAASHQGWKNLLAITSKAWTTGGKDGQGYYGKPVADWDLLSRHSQGIICTTACVFSPIVDPLVAHGDDRKARENFMALREIYRDRLWVEIMPHDWDPQRVMNSWVIGLAQETGTGIMVTGDVHIPRAEWGRAHEVFQMHATHQTMASREKKKEAGEEVYGSSMDTLHMMGDDEIAAAFAKYQPQIPAQLVAEGIANTHEAVKQVKMWTISRHEKLPRVEGDAEQILRDWCEQGMQRLEEKYDDHHWDRWSRQQYRDRLEYEFGVLIKNGVIPYFVIVGELVRWARSDEPLPATEADPNPERKKPIRVGLGRGSAAGCLISYLVGITSIDPIPYDLLFERFLNPDRKGLPDIDLDFSSQGRELVKEYLRRKYGYDHVADVVAHQYFAPRELINDLGRVYGLPFGETDKVKDSISALERGWEKTKKTNPLLQSFADKHEELDYVASIWDGGVHRRSKHAAAIIVTPDSVMEDVPLELQKSKKAGERGTIITGWSNRADFEIIGDFGFLKLDVLGVEDLDRQDYAMEMIRDSEGRFLSQNPFKRGAARVTDAVRPDPLDLPILHDPEAFDPDVVRRFADATIGVFQFHTGLMSSFLRRLKPDRIEDLIVANALNRPGAMSEANKYIERKHGKVPESQWYWHPSVEPFMKDTFGVLAYQEQVMNITKALGNFTGGQADGMRKGISKWYRLGKDEAIKRLREAGYEQQWFEGCVANGIDKSDADRIWNNILDFAGYGFNKSHSASYALQAYQDMDLKVKDPVPFYSAILSYPDDDKGWIERVVREARSLGVEVKQPDINRSGIGFTSSDGQILYGLLAVKGLGDSAAWAIIDEREANGPFLSYGDFARRCPSQAGGVGMALVKAGAFDSTGETRDFLLAEVNKGVKPVTMIHYKCGEAVRCTSPSAVRKASCPTHDVECGERGREEVWERWLVAEHINHNRKLKNPRPLPPERTAPSQRQLVDAEKEALGVLISMEPSIHRHWDKIACYVDPPEAIEQAEDGDDVQIAGEVVKVKPHKTKKGQPMCFLDIAHGAEQYSCTIFTGEYLRYREVLEESDSVIVQGRKNIWNDRESIVVNRLQNLEDFVTEVEEDDAD